jgi:hypothetical protein
MDLDRPDLVAPADSMERADQVARLDRPAGLGGENEPVIQPCPAQLSAIGGLDLAPEIKHSLCYREQREVPVARSSLDRVQPQLPLIRWTCQRTRISPSSSSMSRQRSRSTSPRRRQTSNRVARELYRLLNEPDVRDAVIEAAAERFGYQPSQVHLRLYVGRFAGPNQGHHEKRIRDWCASQIAGAGPIEVFGVEDVVSKVRIAAAQRQYRDNAVLVTMKVLEAARLLTLQLPADVG